MKPARFTYHDPTTVSEAVSLLDSLENAKVLAGGQSLVPMCNFGLVQPDHMIDLNGVTALDGIDITPTGLRLGAMVRQAALMKDPRVVEAVPLARVAASCVGHFQTRSRGTVGGSLTHLDPAAELPLVALLHDSELTVERASGTRRIPMQEWPLGYMTPDLGEDEVLTSIELRSWDEPHGYAFEEFAQRRGDFAIVAVGVLLAVRDATITRAAIAVAGAQSTPSRLGEVEDALVGQPAQPDTFRSAGQVASRRDAMSDAYVDAGYRKRLVAVLTERALASAAVRAAGEGS